MKRTKTPAPKFASEVELCRTFTDAIDRRSWIAYAETAGWDILLVRRADGFQIGVEAKLRLNAEVLAQTLDSDRSYRSTGPDCRAILVPRSDIVSGLAHLSAYIGVTIILVTHPQSAPEYRPAWQRQDVYRPGLPKIDTDRDDWYDWCPMKRCELPEYVPDVAAGAPSPLQLSRWKVKALKIAVLLETRGFVTRSDFKHIGIDIKRWMPKGSGWLVPSDRGFIAGRHLPDFKRQHPVVFEKVRADIRKWEPAQIPLLRNLGG